eukprot:6784796-Pyramimonas_sp.AAC.1
MAKSQQIPNLDSAAINIAQIREQARIYLCDALDSRRGKKALVLDPKLSGPLSLIAEISLLKEHGVENLYYLDNEPIETDCRQIIYLVRVQLAQVSLPCKEEGTPVGVVYRARGPALGSWEDRPPAAYE